MKETFPRIDTFIADAASGWLSRREVIQRAAALGLRAPFAAALINASTVTNASAQTEMTPSFDAGSTGGG